MRDEITDQSNINAVLKTCIVICVHKNKAAECSYDSCFRELNEFGIITMSSLKNFRSRFHKLERDDRRKDAKDGTNSGRTSLTTSVTNEEVSKLSHVGSVRVVGFYEPHV